MKITANKRLFTKQVGVVVSGEDHGGWSIGEWGITRLEDSPKNAVLYAWKHDDLWETIRSGKGRAKYWRKRYVSYEIDGKKVKNTRDILASVDPHEALEYLRIWRDWVWENNANISSLGSTANSIWRGTLSEGAQLMVASGKLPAPTTELFLGGRQEVQRGVYPEAESWDISSAYPAAMHEIAVGARYRHISYADSRVSVLLDDLSNVGFARARVSVKKTHWGPLPYKLGQRTVFPSKGSVEGVFDFSELRVAYQIGLRIYIYEAWIARGLRFPWRRWGRVVMEGRQLPGIAGKLVKASSNSLWGSFAISGSGRWVSYVNGKPYIEPTPEPHKRKNSEILAAHIASHIRGRLFLEGLHFNGKHALACHTDGVIYLPGGRPIAAEREDGLGEWQRRKLLRNLVLVGPATYRYENGIGESRFVVPGAPPQFRERIFAELIKGIADSELGGINTVKEARF